LDGSRSNGLTPKKIGWALNEVPKRQKLTKKLTTKLTNQQTIVNKVVKFEKPTGAGEVGIRAVPSCLHKPTASEIRFIQRKGGGKGGLENWRRGPPASTPLEARKLLR